MFKKIKHWFFRLWLPKVDWDEMDRRFYDYHEYQVNFIDAVECALRGLPDDERSLQQMKEVQERKAQQRADELAYRAKRARHKRLRGEL